MTKRRKSGQSPEVTLLAAVQRPMPDVVPTKAVRLDIDAETFAFFGADTRQMEAVLRAHAEEQSVKRAYEMMRLSRKRSK